jgi:hypothetical protein
MYKSSKLPAKVMLDTVLKGDCGKVLRGVPQNSIHLTVTSPPYDDLRQYGGHDFDMNEVARELYRVTAHEGVVVWVVADKAFGVKDERPGESATSFRQCLHFMSVGFTLHATMIAQWPNKMSKQKYRYERNFDFMFVLCKGARPRVTNIRRVPCQNAGHTVSARVGHTSDQVGPYRDRGGERKRVVVNEDKPDGSIWNYSTGLYQTSSDTVSWDHPCPFPEPLVQDHIRSWSNPGDIVLDPFCGSGTTCKIARLEQRYWLGIEACPEYVEMARKRVETCPRFKDRPGSSTSWRPVYLEGESKTVAGASVTIHEPKSSKGMPSIPFDWRESEPMVDLATAAKITRRSCAAVRMLTRRGRIPFVADGKKIRVPLRALESLPRRHAYRGSLGAEATPSR